MPKILIVEDDDQIRQAYEAICKKQGWEVKAAPEGQTGLAITRDFEPDIILLDMLMPTLNGAEFLREYRKINKKSSAAVLILSNSKVPEKMMADVKAMGVVEYLPKAETSGNQLVELVSKYLPHQRNQDGAPTSS